VLEEKSTLLQEKIPDFNLSISEFSSWVFSSYNFVNSLISCLWDSISVFILSCKPSFSLVKLEQEIKNLKSSIETLKQQHVHEIDSLCTEKDMVVKTFETKISDIHDNFGKKKIVLFKLSIWYWWSFCNDWVSFFNRFLNSCSILLKWSLEDKYSEFNESISAWWLSISTIFFLPVRGGWQRLKNTGSPS
jgi:hypothetical protein